MFNMEWIGECRECAPTCEELFNIDDFLMADDDFIMEVGEEIEVTAEDLEWFENASDLTCFEMLLERLEERDGETDLIKMAKIIAKQLNEVI